MKKQAGFTLVELIAVIVILGILSAVAVPKFISLESNARVASLEGLKGGVVSAFTLVNALAIVEGQTGATGSVTVGGTTVSLVYGYPATGSINGAMSNTDGFTFSAGTYTITGYSGSNCNVVYTQSTGANIPPTVATTTSGC